ncbi:tubulin-specific chaperone C-like [Saccoglossus kowalevskii]|uniref:Tubulin-specific chaperone C-like n=1 Tax=Saccoglossus kowalevskii TaxID=10224 RepID=A0ABM0GQQ5_SACKO|nr:PREDICTED: tubulin-specific chaperone C-like [Saccoglossus kowalevskii]
MADTNQVYGSGDQKIPALAEKMEKITDRLLRREEQRQAELEKKRIERENASLKQESADYFSSAFQEARQKIEQKMIGVEQVTRSKMIDYFDEISADIQQLQKFVSDSAMFLPSYDIKVAQEAITKLQQAVTEKRDEKMPKKKFTFKSRRKDTGQSEGTVDVDAAKKNVSICAHMAQVISDTGKMECSVSDKKAEKVSLDETEVNGKDVGLFRLVDSVVKVRGSPSALHINSLTNCKVFCGPVPGSIFVDECVNCILVVSCQQLRVHHTTDTQFYLHVTSRAIIEDTTRVEFAPYTWSYVGIDQHFSATGLERKRNTWDDVDDFNWLASDKHSPNWSLIPEKKRVTSWDP